MEGLETTNLLLGIMAAVSVLEALLLVGMAVGGYWVYSSLLTTIRQLEERQVAPLSAKAQEILSDLKDVSLLVREETQRMDEALRGTMDRVDETAEIVRSRVKDRTSQAVNLVKGLRAGIESLLSNGSKRGPAAPASGRL